MLFFDVLNIGLPMDSALAILDIASRHLLDMSERHDRAKTCGYAEGKAVKIELRPGGLRTVLNQLKRVVTGIFVVLFFQKLKAVVDRANLPRKVMTNFA